jgi:hypothetical protein
MSIRIFPRVVALTLMLGAITAAALRPAHATDGETAARKCIDNDACHINVMPDGTSFTITIEDGGGSIYCGSVNEECVVVSPDTGKGHKPTPVAAPIGKTPGPNKGPITGTGNPVTNNPVVPKGPIGTVPTGFHPIHGPVRQSGNPTGNAGAPILLVRSGHGRH